MKSLKREIQKKQKLIIYILITLCLLFGNFKLFFRPTVGSLMKTVPEVRELQRKVSFAQKAVTNIPIYKKQIKELQDRLSSYKKEFSTEQQTSTLLRELSDMAKSSGVKIVAIKPHPAVVASKKDVSIGAYQKFPISIQASCGYHQLGTFLNKMENADTFIRVTDIRITSNAQDPMEQVVFIVVNTYIITEGI